MQDHTVAENIQTAEQPAPQKRGRGRPRKYPIGQQPKNRHLQKRAEIKMPPELAKKFYYFDMLLRISANVPPLQKQQTLDAALNLAINDIYHQMKIRGVTVEHLVAQYNEQQSNAQLIIKEVEVPDVERNQATVNTFSIPNQQIPKEHGKVQTATTRDHAHKVVSIEPPVVKHASDKRPPPDLNRRPRG